MKKASNWVKIVKRIGNVLDSSGNKKKREGVEAYLKNQVLSRGNSNPSIAQCYRNLKNHDDDYKELTYDEKYSLGKELLQNKFIDDKLIACSILSEIHKNLLSSHIDELKNLIRDTKCINEWATSDTFSAKVLRPFSLLSKQNTIQITDWKDDIHNIWVRRSSCVTFITRVKHNNKKPNFPGFIDIMFSVAKENVKYSERFNQLAVGWLLRELSLVDLRGYKEFFYGNFSLLSREAIRYSVEKLKPIDKKILLSYRGKPEEPEKNNEKRNNFKKK
jgi:3-methyladenine DNA glycosylase AlkD